MTTNVDESTSTQEVSVPSPSPSRDVLPFGWEAATTDVRVDSDEPDTYFRFPAANDPNPGTWRLLTMSLYTALLGLGGFGVGVRGLVSSIGGEAPWWYVPALAAGGLLSVAFSVGAFLSIHRLVLPWLLLLAAAAPLSGAVVLAVAY
jgi:hypothetical protein